MKIIIKSPHTLLTKKKLRFPADICAFFTLYVFVFIYNFHKYIFKYASSTTSPTYSDTPLVWKAGKFIIIFLLIFVYYLLVKYNKKGLNVVSYSIIFFGVFTLIFIVLHFLISGEALFDEIEYEFYFFVCLPLFFIKPEALYEINILIEKSHYILGWGLTIGNIIVISNFLIFNRLPAIGYENSLVRFGGLWDDPNTFAFYCTFLFFINFNNKRYLLSFFLLIDMLLAFSISSYIMFFVSIFYWFQNNLVLKKRYIAIFLILSTTLVFTLFKYYDLIQTFWNLKQASAQDHVNYNITFNGVPGMLGAYYYSETWYFSYFINYFPLSIILILIIIFYLIFNLFISKIKNNVKFFILLFLLGNFFLPFMYMFPANFMFFIYIIIYLRSRDVFEIEARGFGN